MSASEVMASEFEAAAERILMQGAEQEEHYWATGRSFEADAVMVAREYVDRLAADRAEREERARPIDAEWLESIGAIRKSSCVCPGVALFTFRTPIPVATVELSECPGGSWYVLLTQDDDVVTLRNISNRAELLDLLRVLKGGAE